jgi:hypothetical protein
MIVRNGKVESEETINSQARLQEIFKDYFGIKLTGSYVRHREINMKACQQGIHRPPILHRYPTRLKTQYLALAQEIGEDVSQYQARISRLR